LLLQWKKYHMSFKEWTASQKSPSKDNPNEKSKIAPAGNKPAVQADKKPVVADSAPKS